MLKMWHSSIILTLFTVSSAFAVVLKQEGHFHPAISYREAPLGYTYSLNITGTLMPGEKASQLLNKISATFIEPIETGKISTDTYIMQVSGPDYIFNFVAEPASLDKVKEFMSFIEKREALGFHGQAIHFKKVISLHEVATFQAGNYNDQLEDPFDMNFDLKREFDFKTLAEWENFTDTYGYALLSHDHQEFEKYLESFIADPVIYSQVTEILKRDNMAAIDPRVSLLLEDQSKVDSDFEHTAFLPFKFFRNCFLSNYENGTCYK
jgi:hypothetical protein